MIKVINLIFNFSNFSVLFTKPLTSGILFSTAVNVELVAKPVILGILSSTLLILELKSVFLTKPLTSDIFYLPYRFYRQNLIHLFHICFF